MPIKGRLGPRSPPFFFFHSLLFTLRYKLHSLSAIPFRSSIPDRIVAWPRLRDEKDGDSGSEDRWMEGCDWSNRDPSPVENFRKYDRLKWIGDSGRMGE